MTSRVNIFFKDLFNDSKFHKSLFKVALPIIIQNLITSSLNMIDTIMIGKIGEIEIASVGIANQYFFLFNMIIMGIFSGCGIFISQFWGKRDIKNIRRILGFGVIVGVIISLLFTGIAFIIPDKIIAIFNTDAEVVLKGSKYLRIVCLSYIFTALTYNFGFASRCIEKTVLPMLVSMFAIICNTFLNYTLIFGKFGAKPMGVEGAALATLISRIIETIILITYIYKSHGILAAKLKEMMDISRDFVIKVFRTVMTVVLNEACWGLGAVTYSIVYGRIGAKAIASIQITNTIYNFFMVIIFGMANAAAVMIGNKVGQGQQEDTKKYATRFIVISCFIGLWLAIILYFTAPVMITFFNVSEEVMHDSLMILYIISAIMIVRVFNIILIVGVLRGGGDSGYALITEAFTMWGIGVPLAFIGAFLFKLPVYVVYGLVTAEEIVKFIIGMRRFRSNKWIKNVIHDM